ncbi:hypothetical protein V5F90_03390 [Priestia aryabhattai]
MFSLICKSVPTTIIRKFAMQNKVKHRGRDIEEVLEELVQNNLKDKLEYLEKQYVFSGSNLTLIKTDDKFPGSSKNSSGFIKKLIHEGYIQAHQVNNQWEPSLRPAIQICAVEHIGNDVYLKLVEEKRSLRKQGYRRPYYEGYASYTTIVIHFSNQVVQLRCAYTDRKKYASYVMKLLGLGEAYDKWHTLSSVTKDEAVEISKMLSAGLKATQINIPSSVGALKFFGKKDIDLRADKNYSKLKEVIEKHAELCIDDVFDETCEFVFKDPKAGIDIPASFEINLKNGGFKFNNVVPDVVYEQVIEAFVHVNYTSKFKGKKIKIVK